MVETNDTIMLLVNELATMKANTTNGLEEKKTKIIEEYTKTFFDDIKYAATSTGGYSKKYPEYEDALTAVAEAPTLSALSIAESRLKLALVAIGVRNPSLE